MKKNIFLLILVFCLTGCSSKKLNFDTLEAQHEDNRMVLDFFHFAGKGDKLYLEDFPQQLYFIDSNFQPIDLGCLNYIDDKKYSSNSDITELKKYSDEKLDDLYYYDSKLYFTSFKRTIEGDSGYYLNYIDEKGENRKQIFSFSYFPKMFIVQNGYLIVVEQKDDFHQTVHIYNDQLKEVKTIIPEAPIARLFAVNEKVYLFSAAYKDNLYGDLIINLNDLSVSERLLNEKEYTVFVRENSFATRSLDKYIDEVDDPMKITHTSRIYDNQTKDILFEVTNELICYYDDSFIYTITANTPNTKYHVYDFDGNLVNEIIPSHSLKRDPKMRVIFVNQDFGFIYRVINDNIIIGTLNNNDNMEYVHCSLTDGKCSVFLERQYDPNKSPNLTVMN